MFSYKSLLSAVILLGLMSGADVAQAENSDAKLYVEIGGTWAHPGDADAEFTTENLNASWDLGDMTGGKLQIGADLGKTRVDAKVTALTGDVDGISGATGVKSVTGGQESDTALIVGTLNVYYDFTDINKSSITPYVGIGIGYARGFMQAEGTMATILREDHRSDSGTAIAGTVGALFSTSEKMGITAEYEYLDVGIGGLSVHSTSVGLRFSF